MGLSLAFLVLVAAAACGEPAPSREGEAPAAEPAPAPPDEPVPSPDAGPGPGQEAEPNLSGELRAFGTEPFWSVTVGADSIRLLDLATGDTIAWAATEPIDAEARPPALARVWILDPAALVVLAVRRADDGCSDGMSDRLHPWFALFLRGDRLYEGCARVDSSTPRASAAGAATDARANP